MLTSNREVFKALACVHVCIARGALLRLCVETMSRVRESRSEVNGVGVSPCCSRRCPDGRSRSPLGKIGPTLWVRQKPQLPMKPLACSPFQSPSQHRAVGRGRCGLGRQELKVFWPSRSCVQSIIRLGDKERPFSVSRSLTRSGSPAGGLYGMCSTRRPLRAREAAGCCRGRARWLGNTRKRGCASFLRMTSSR